MFYDNTISAKVMKYLLNLCETIQVGAKSPARKEYNIKTYFMVCKTHVILNAMVGYALCLFQTGGYIRLILCRNVKLSV